MMTKAEIRELIEARKEFNPMSGIEKLIASGEATADYVAAAKASWDATVYLDNHGHLPIEKGTMKA